MAVNGTAAYGMYPHNVALPAVVDTLNQAGFDKEDICMVLSPAHPDAAAVRDARMLGTERQEEAALGARMIGWFSEFGAVVIPTVGFFIRSHAFFRALMTQQDLLCFSRGARTLEGLGFSEQDAKRLGRDLGDLGVLVYVSCPQSDRAESATELLRKTGAQEVASLARARGMEAVA